MHRQANTTVKTSKGLSGSIDIEIGLHQGSALSPFLFILLVDVLSEELQTADLIELLFANFFFIPLVDVLS